ncbi:MAG: hypothetical protein IIA53_10985, partial [Chloroflexi bacterium]|nr:hypothetical protein [Chloroflexota bacterium]
MIENSVLKANREGRKATVFALAFPALYLVEMAAHVGFDAISIDGEHGAFPEDAIDDICRVSNALGMSVSARVPDSAPYQVNLYLDRGIQGVTGPHINTGAEAQALADACLFPVEGKRSWGGGPPQTARKHRFDEALGRRRAGGTGDGDHFGGIERLSVGPGHPPQSRDAVTDLDNADLMRQYIVVNVAIDEKHFRTGGDRITQKVMAIVLLPPNGEISFVHQVRPGVDAH